MPTPIPFSKPHLVGRELEYIAQAVAEGNASGDGRFSEACCRLLVTEDLSARLLRLRLYYDLTESEIERVAESIEEFFAAR